MALTLETILRDALANSVDDAVNSGAGTATLTIRSAAEAILSTHNLQNPAFGAAATGVITLAGTPIDDTSANAGTAAEFHLTSRNADKLLEGTVATSGADINISSTAIGAGDTVSLQSFTITMPAS